MKSVDWEDRGRCRPADAGRFWSQSESPSAGFRMVVRTSRGAPLVVSVVDGPSVDGSNPAISGHRKSGHFRRPETGVEFYLTAPCVGKVVWTLVRQLRGPHFSTCA